MAESKKKWLCGTEPWVSADMTEEAYREWLDSIKRTKPVK